MAREYLKGAGLGTLAGLGGYFAQRGERVRKEMDKAYTKYTELLENPAYVLKPGKEYKKGNTIPQVIELFEYDKELAASNYESTTKIPKNLVPLYKELYSEYAEFITEKTTIGGINAIKERYAQEAIGKRQLVGIGAREDAATAKFDTQKELLRIKQASKNEKEARDLVKWYLNQGPDIIEQLNTDPLTKATLSGLLKAAGYKIGDKAYKDFTGVEKLKNIIPFTGTPQEVTPTDGQGSLQEQIPPTAPVQDAPQGTQGALQGATLSPEATQQAIEEISAALASGDAAAAKQILTDPNGKYKLDPASASQFKKQNRNIIMKRTQEIQTTGQQTQLPPQAAPQVPGQLPPQGAGQQTARGGLLPNSGPKNRLKALLLRAQSFDINAPARA